MIVKLAPRVILYEGGSIPPSVSDGCLALPQIASRGLLHAVFGDGSHPTTRLCGAALDQLCLTLKPQAVLDVGTGTGVLARIARARGASFVVGTDIDPAALESAAAHAALDSATTAGGPRTAASAPGDFTPRSAATPHRATTTRRAAAIEFAAAPPDAWGPRFDIVVANILERPLLDMAPQLAAAMRPASLLLLSGFTRPQSPALKVRFTRAGLSLAAESFLEDWVLLHFASPRS